MATNNFKSFATGAGANVTSQADYEALSALASGFQAGKASSAQINKALRQSSSVSAMLGQFIGAAGLDALDNGNIATLLSNFTAALTTNLSLGTASKKNVGTGANQIPDMSFFQSVSSINGWNKLPNGLIEQWGSATVETSTNNVLVNLPIAFPNMSLGAVASDTGESCIPAGVQLASASSVRIFAPNYFINSSGQSVRRPSVVFRFRVVGY